jgi:hypothetical protein
MLVRRILARRFRPPSGRDGPSWLTLIGDTADSLWNVDLFRCESIVLKSYWVMAVMDLFTRRIVGFGVAPTDIDGVAADTRTDDPELGRRSLLHRFALGSLSTDSPSRPL